MLLISKVKLGLLSLTCLAFMQSTAAQQATQKLSETNKSWRVHWGVYGGLGVANEIPTDNINYYHNNYDYDEFGNFIMAPIDAQIVYAPRPELKAGFTCELEAKKLISFRLGIGYMMRAIPEPTFGTVANPASKQYKSTYLNGVNWSGTLFFRASKKIKFGIGLESSMFMILPHMYDKQHYYYTQQRSTSHGIKTEICYNLTPRVDLTFYALASASHVGFNNVSAGATVGYRIRGKEIRLKKEVYKLDYSVE